MKRFFLKLSIPCISQIGRSLFKLGRLLSSAKWSGDPKKILVVKLWAIGEVVLATPVLEAIKHRYPRSELHLLVGTAARAVVENNPYCDRLIVVEEHMFWRMQLSPMLTLAKRLRGESYDCAVILHQFFLFGLLTWWAGIRMRVGVDRNGEGFALTIKVPTLTGKVHRTQEYLSVVEAMGASGGTIKPIVRPSNAAIEKAESILCQLQIGKWGCPLVVVLPTGGANDAANAIFSNIVSKRWPVENYVELTAKLAKKDIDILVLGGKAEETIKPLFFNLSSRRQVHVLIGETSLEESIGLIARASVVITNDSGPMHIAGALGRPVVSVFGPTSPLVVGPVSEGSVVLCADLECSPCFREEVFPNEFPHCVHQRCMKSVNVDMAFQAVIRALDVEGTKEIA